MSLCLLFDTINIIQHSFLLLNQILLFSSQKFWGICPQGIGVKCSVCCFCKPRQIKNAFIFWCWNFLTSCMTLFATLPNNYNRWLDIQIVTKEFHSGAKLGKLMPILSVLLCFCHSFPQHHLQEDGPKDQQHWVDINQPESYQWSLQMSDELLTRRRNNQTQIWWKCKCIQM